jgi:polysaccharide biosynthesis/export protein
MTRRCGFLFSKDEGFIMPGHQSSRTATMARVAFLITLLWLGAVSIRADGQQAANTRATAAPAPDPARPKESLTEEYVIGPDDLLSVVFWRDQQLSGDVLVRPDGKISLPLLDDIQAAGLTPRQLRDRLLGEARRFISEPVATVVVRQVNSRKVYITGLVARPGQYSLTPSMNVLQLIATAGGLLDFAKSREIRVVRVENGKAVNIRFDYDEITTKPEKTAQNIELKPGDTIIVP